MKRNAIDRSIGEMGGEADGRAFIILSRPIRPTYRYLTATSSQFGMNDAFQTKCISDDYLSTMSLQAQPKTLATAAGPAPPSLLTQVGMAGTAAVITVTFIHPIDVVKVGFDGICIFDRGSFCHHGDQSTSVCVQVFQMAKLRTA